MASETAMKTFSLYVGVLGLCLSCLAQSTETPLGRVLNQRKTLKELRLGALADGDVKSAGRMLEMEAMALSSLSGSSQRAELAVVYRDAANLYQQAGETLWAASMFGNQGNVEWELGNFDGALAAFQEAEKQFLSSNNVCMATQASLSQARVLMASSREADTAQATRILARASSDAQPRDARCSIGSLLMAEAEMLGRVTLTSAAQRKLKSATIRFVRLAADAFSREGEPNKSGEALLALAGNVRVMGSSTVTEARRELLADAVRYFQTSRNFRGVALARLQEADLAKSWSEAEPLLKEAAAIFAQIPDDVGLGWVSVSRARQLVAKEDRAEAMKQAQEHFERAQSWEDLAKLFRTKADESRLSGDLKEAASSLLKEGRAWNAAGRLSSAGTSFGDAARIMCSTGDLPGGRSAFRDALANLSLDPLSSAGPAALDLMTELKECTQATTPQAKPRPQAAKVPRIPPASGIDIQNLLAQLRPIEKQIANAEALIHIGDVQEIQLAAAEALRRLDEIDAESRSDTIPGAVPRLTAIPRARSWWLLARVHLLTGRVREAAEAYSNAVRVGLREPHAAGIGLAEELTSGDLGPFGGFGQQTEDFLAGSQVAIYLASRSAGDEALRRAMRVLMPTVWGANEADYLAQLRDARGVFADRGEPLAVGHTCLLEARSIHSDDPILVIRAARKALELIPERRLPASRFLAWVALFDAYSAQEDKLKETEEAAFRFLDRRS